MKKYVWLFILISLILFSFSIDVEAENSDNLVNIYFFHSNTCSHCKEELKLLSELEEFYDNVRIYKYEVHEEENYKILEKVEEFYDTKISGVPLTIIGDKVYSGFSSEKSKFKFIKTIEYFSRYGYYDNLGKYLGVELANYEISNDIELDYFINTYKNYKVLGLKTDDLDAISVALLLGIVDSFEWINIVSIVLMILVLIKVRNEYNKLKFTMVYLFFKVILTVSNLMENIYVNLVISLLMFLLVIFNLRKIKTDKSDYQYLNIIILILISINYWNSGSNVIFNDILSLHKLNIIDSIMYYCNYIVVMLIINIVIIYLCNFGINKLVFWYKRKDKFKIDIK